MEAPSPLNWYRIDVLSKARSLDELCKTAPVAKEVREKYMQKLEDANLRERRRTDCGCKC
jgi:hypothetical protein